MPNRPGTKGRNIRIPDADWQAFRAAAIAAGSTASAEILAFVRRYVQERTP